GAASTPLHPAAGYEAAGALVPVAAPLSTIVTSRAVAAPALRHLNSDIVDVHGGDKFPLAVLFDHEAGVSLRFLPGAVDRYLDDAATLMIRSPGHRIRGHSGAGREDRAEVGVGDRRVGTESG